MGGFIVGEVKIGALVWPQFTEWKSVKSMGVTADRVGFDTLWTWDHMYPIIGNPNGPMFEGWSTLVSWAENTSRIRIGLMVGANTFREPTITAKLATTLDHISNGRAILGVGAAWFEEEHEHFGLNFGDGFPERLRWLGEALPIMRGMLDGTEPTATGPRYKAKTVRNLPAPIQKHLPIIIGGGGPRRTPALAARYAAEFNLAFPTREFAPVQIGRVRAALQRTGRRTDDMIFSAAFAVCAGRDDAEVARRADAISRDVDELRANTPLAGTPAEIVDRLGPFAEAGVQRVYLQLLDTRDLEHLEFFAAEVMRQMR
jgi:alkanesulfonate monooxygenase SsuD/methylene tetrahydromethanopterin reductase-like flavin-dependent oxidoreductase (luciferase family)